MPIFPMLRRRRNDSVQRSGGRAGPPAPRAPTGPMTALALESERIMTAAAAGDSALVRRLLAAGADPNASSAPRVDGRSPLHLAAEGNHVGVVVALLDRGADVDARDRTGETTLAVAVKGMPESISVLEMLDFAGADPTMSDEKGIRPYDLALVRERFPDDVLARWIDEYQIP